MGFVLERKIVFLILFFKYCVGLMWKIMVPVKVSVIYIYIYIYIYRLVTNNYRLLYIVMNSLYNTHNNTFSYKTYLLL